MLYLQLFSCLCLALFCGVALAAAPVGNLQTGFVDIDTEGAVGEIFYAFAPPQNGDKNAPLLLWFQGGPGSSGIQFGLLQELGPVYFDTNSGTAQDRTDGGAWNQEFAVLFVDQPVGTGYSTATTYVQNQADVGAQMVSFLHQWYALNLWPQGNDFYITGESYGGKYVPAVAHAVLEANNASTTPQAQQINLVGIAIGDGFTDPARQILTKSDQAFAFGLVDEQTRDAAQVYAQQAHDLCGEKNFTAAFEARQLMEALILDTSGINPYDVREFGDYDEDTLAAWLDSTAGKTAFGVPQNRSFGTDAEVGAALANDEMRSTAYLFADLIHQLPKGVLLYQGQFDWKDGYTATAQWVQDLNWPGAEAFSTADRSIWKVQASGLPAGWVKGPVQAAGDQGSLTHVVVVSAGHLVPMDQPVAAYDMIQRFITGAGFN